MSELWLVTEIHCNVVKCYRWVRGSVSTWRCTTTHTERLYYSQEALIHCHLRRRRHKHAPAACTLRYVSRLEASRRRLSATCEVASSTSSHRTLTALNCASWPCHATAPCRPHPLEAQPAARPLTRLPNQTITSCFTTVVKFYCLLVL